VILSITSPTVGVSIPSQDINWPTEGWTFSTPTEQGMNESKLLEMVDHIEENFISINAIVVIRNGCLVFEQYFDFFDENQTSNIFSCTKSFTSTCVGMALQQGYLQTTQQRVLDFFQDRTIENPHAWKESMTIEDLLTMTAGFEWNDNSDAGMSEYNNMIRSEDWVQYVLDRPMAVEPGLVWNYNSGASHLLSAIVQNVTGMTAEEFAIEHLFTPLGIDDMTWREDPNGITIGGNTIQLVARDMAKFGYLFLKNGEWDGVQIVSPEWVENASMSHSQWPGGGYGYQWWTRSDVNSYFAAGYSGQFIHIAPDHDVVVAVKASSGIPFDTLGDWIIPSILEGPGSGLPNGGPDLTLTITLVSISLISIVVIVIIIRKIK
jgi:CubicO group peptidase (beta-lactamase class C family)